jgi:hypothetical protein
MSGTTLLLPSKTAPVIATLSLSTTICQIPFCLQTASLIQIRRETHRTRRPARLYRCHYIQHLHVVPAAAVAVGFLFIDGLVV